MFLDTVAAQLMDLERQCKLIIEIIELVTEKPFGHWLFQTILVIEVLFWTDNQETTRVLADLWESVIPERNKTRS